MPVWRRSCRKLSSHPTRARSIPFRLYCADDLQGKADRIKQVRLKVYIGDIVSEDRVRFLLNGESLENETCLRHFPKGLPPYHGQWLDFDLRRARPRKGWNTLEIVLDGRPADLISPLVVQDIELIVEYGPYPSKLDSYARIRQLNEANWEHTNAMDRGDTP